jgi:hypothetical protein
MVTVVKLTCIAFVAMKVVTFSKTIKWETQKIRFSENATEIYGSKINDFSC